MFLRKIRWLGAGLLAAIGLLTSPARSEAGIEVLIAEVDGAGTIVGSPQLFLLFGSGSSTPNTSTTSFTNITVGVTTSSGSISPSHSLTSTVNLQPSSLLTTDHTLRVIVTDNGYQIPAANINGNAVLKNNAGSSAGINGQGTNTASIFTEFLPAVGPYPPINTSPPSDKVSSVTINELGLASFTPMLTPTTITGTPGTFALRQTIKIEAKPGVAGIDDSSTLGGTLSSTLNSTPAPIPAPAGLVLGLIAVPALYLRKRLTKSTQAEAV